MRYFPFLFLFVGMLLVSGSCEAQNNQSNVSEFLSLSRSPLRRVTNSIGRYSNGATIGRSRGTLSRYTLYGTNSFYPYARARASLETERAAIESRRLRTGATSTTVSHMNRLPNLNTVQRAGVNFQTGHPSGYNYTSRFYGSGPTVSGIRN